MVRFSNQSNMVSNPYPPHKVINPTLTTCEICERTIMTKDWRAHKSSKKHREVEKRLAEEEKAKNNPDSGGWGDANITNDQTTSGNSCRNCGEDGHFAKDCAAPKKSRACRKCGQEDHIARDCPEGGNGGGGSSGACYKCGEEGHISRECPQGGGGGGGGGPCYNCGEEGHMSRDCTQERKASGGGGSRTCRNCDQEGHIARDCTEPRVLKCRNCDEIGHAARDCTKKKDWSRVKCNNCGNMGHTVKRCPDPIREDLDQGGFGSGGGAGSGGRGGGGGGGEGVAAIGGWDAPVAEASGGWATGDATTDSTPMHDAPVVDDSGW